MTDENLGGEPGRTQVVKGTMKAKGERVTLAGGVHK